MGEVSGRRPAGPGGDTLAAPSASVRRVLRVAEGTDRGGLLRREWLVANGLGGYASASVAGDCTRKHHGLLVAALPAPLGRVVMLSELGERMEAPGGEMRLGGREEGGMETLREFLLEDGLPVWRYEGHSLAVEKRLLLPHRQNTVYISYRLAAGEGPARLWLRPYLHFRPLEREPDHELTRPYAVQATGDRYEVKGEGGLPVLRMFLAGRAGSFSLTGGEFRDFLYPVEQQRGGAGSGNVWSPGAFQVELAAQEDVTLIASTESWDVIDALQPEAAFRAEAERRQRLLAVAPPAARWGTGAELALAADQFIIAPSTRVAEAARAHAAGDSIRSVIAGYHWFTDWGRDTMISLEGLSLATGRYREAAYILRTFAGYIRDGLIPNLFLEGRSEGLYHTADATLWYFHAIDRYLSYTGDLTTLRQLLPRLVEVVQHHIQGTRFGIGADPADGLLRQGAPGYQLTWMDAKVGDWVVTPRRGKAVEINGLWYNALRLLESWLESEGREEQARPLRELADRAAQSFNRRFWNERTGCLYDVVDGEGGDDPAIRPNQLIAFSLRHPALDPSRWEPVLRVVQETLLTPFGLRTLAPGHPDYKLRYYGGLLARDAAYHQGTVWPWLIGPFIDAWLRVHPDDSAGARRFLEGIVASMADSGLGLIGEVFDAEPPFHPGGCVAQAWSVAETLRGWIRTAPAVDA